MTCQEPQRRLALFVPNLEGGGAERVFLDLANQMARSRGGVDLVLQHAIGRYLQYVDPRVRVIDLGARRLAFSVLPLARYLRRERPVALLSTPSSANIIAVFAASVALVPVRIIVREAITASVDDALVQGIREKSVVRLRRWAYNRTDRVIAPSLGVADDLIRHVRLSPGSITVIPNPLDIDSIEQFASEEVGSLAIPPGAVLVVGVGRLEHQKDFGTLIRAFAGVASRRDAYLLLLGEGPDRPMLERLAGQLGVCERVIMPGFAENPFAYMRKASVFVLSSRYEGLPNVLLQALQVGVPVVATDCPSGPTEILEGGRWGQLVPVGDSAAMTRAICEVLDGDVRRPSADLIRNRYGVVNIARRYASVLEPAPDSNVNGGEGLGR